MSEPPPSGQWSPPSGQWSPPPGPEGRRPSPPTGWGEPSASYGFPHRTGGWQPPPKPGVVPLRPLGLGELIDGSVQTMRQNPRVMFGLSAVVMAVAVVLSTLLLLLGLPRLVTGLESSGDTLSTEQIASTASAGIIAVLVPAVLQSFAVVVLTGVLILAVSDAVLGRRPGVGEVVRRARGRIVALIGLSLLTGFILLLALLLLLAPGTILLTTGGSAWIGGTMLGLGFVAAVVVGVWLWVRFAFAAPALLLEELGVVPALRRSWRLGLGSWWRMFGILLLTAIIAGFANGLLAVPFSVLGGVIGALLTSGSDGSALTGEAISSAVGGLGTILATTVTAPFSAAVTALLYIDLRMRREGLDVVLARAAAEPAPPPTAPAP